MCDWGGTRGQAGRKRDSPFVGPPFYSFRSGGKSPNLWLSLFSNLSFSADVHWLVLCSARRSQFQLWGLLLSTASCKLSYLSVCIRHSNSHKPSSNIFIFIHSATIFKWWTLRYLLYIWVIYYISSKCSRHWEQCIEQNMVLTLLELTFYKWVREMMRQ